MKNHGNNLKWSSNSKLRKTRTISLPLPARITCPGAGACLGICYASKNCYMFGVVRRAHAHNLAMTKRRDFVRLASADIARMIGPGHKAPAAIRWQDAGDIYSQAYLEKFIQVCKAFPKVRFYAYTKSLHLDWTGKPANFLRIASYGGKYDDRIDRRQHHARIFPSMAALKRAGYAPGYDWDLPSMPNCPRKIGLVLH